MSKRRYRQKRHFRLALCCVGMLAAAAIHVSVGVYLANDESDDGKLYSQMAVTLLEQGVYSVETHPPYTPSLIRLPGYPLFLAGIYSIAGHGNNTAVRATQGVTFAFTSLLASLLAWNWAEGKRRRRRKAAVWAFILTALCPFTAIYSAMILTETLTMFFLAASTLSATRGIKAAGRAARLGWWAASGLLAGAAVLLRPDSGLFALGLGLTLAASLFFRRPDAPAMKQRFAGVIAAGLIFSIMFVAPLVPWTIRNERVIGVFQPLAPAHADAPGEFVPYGYLHWLRTWIDDQRYIPVMLWGLEQQRITIDKIPAYAFDSDQERKQVSDLLDRYNDSDPDHPLVPKTKAETADQDDDDSHDGDNDADSGDDSDDAGDSGDQDSQEMDLTISPEVDVAFDEIAQARVARRPWHYYLELPAERSASMWFDTHSAYYPFEGELFPTKDLDNDENQEFWLPLFAALVWVYTLLAAAGATFLLLERRKRSRLWLLMVLFLAVPRIAFFGTLENPEPRYLVELFILAAILAGIALSRLQISCRAKTFGLELYYGND